MQVQRVFNKDEQAAMQIELNIVDFLKQSGPQVELRCCRPSGLGTTS